MTAPVPPRSGVRRSRTGAVLGGVCAGVARSAGLDPLLLRIAVVAVTLLTGGAGLLAYLAAWVLIPREEPSADELILRGQGEADAPLDIDPTALDRDRDTGDAVEAEGVLRGGQRALLGADAEPVAGILHVGAGHDLSVDGLDRAADVEVRIRRVSFLCRLAGERNQLFRCHEFVLMRGEVAAATSPESCPT